MVSCGDCAGLVDPISGEGSGAAFASGVMSARAVADYLGGRGAVSLEDFSQRIGEFFSRRYDLETRGDSSAYLHLADEGFRSSCVRGSTLLDRDDYTELS